MEQQVWSLATRANQPGDLVSQFDIEMIAVEGHTPVLIGGAGKQGARKFAGQFVRRIHSTLGLPQEAQNQH